MPSDSEKITNAICMMLNIEKVDNNSNNFPSVILYNFHICMKNKSNQMIMMLRCNNV